MKLSFRHMLGFLASLLLLHLLSPVALGHSLFYRRSTVAARLEAQLPQLQASGVRFYRNQSWCKAYLSAQGAFVETTHASTCVAEEAQPFTLEARHDFRQLERRLRGSGVRVLYLSLVYSGEELLEATFHLDCLFCSRLRYVYRSAYGALPEDVPREQWFRRVNRDWYTLEEDWN